MIRFLRSLMAQRDRGIALPLVLGVGMTLSALLVAGVAYSVGTLDKARSDQDWSGALAAAYAAIEEYQSRLANDTTYFQYGNPASTFSRPFPADPSNIANSNVTLPTGSATNAAFGVGVSGTWATVPGSDGTSQFRYEVDNSAYYSSGTLRLQATGRVGAETRSIVADLRQRGFIDFLYFTDYEIQDPQITGDNVATCVRYAWAGRPNTGCKEIAFGSNDVVDGPAHSNDIMRVCNARFTRQVTTGYNPASATALLYRPRDSNYNSCTGQVFDLAGQPSREGVIGMPPTNTQLKRETRSDLTGVDVPRPGCLYTGPTTIRFNSNGTMTVRSPWTRATNVAGDPATSGTTPAACGLPGTGANQLGSAAGATITVPANNVVYVQDVPTTAGNPNTWATTAKPTGITCTTGANGSNGIGFPMAREDTPKAATSTNPAYACRKGDVFVQGTLEGQLTVAAENYIYITGNLAYEDRDRDILGLVGNNAVFVWNPTNGSNNRLLTDYNRTIDAAILSVAHTFQVQNYDEGGDRGELRVYGAIAQKFRGVVRGGTNGYSKEYVYDDRYVYTAPPKFLSPVTTTYGVSVWIEVSPIFAADGSYL